jgi:hypothetical protein
MPQERKVREPVPLPDGITVLDEQSPGIRGGGYRDATVTPGRLAIVRRWFHPGKHLFMLGFVIFWDVFLYLWFNSPARGAGSFTLEMFPLIHAVVGGALTYSTLAALVNRTWIRVERATLSVKHGPLPWLGGRTYAAGELQQLFCEKEEKSRNRDSTIVYHLSAVDRDHAKLRLIKNLELDQALYLEQKIEMALEIADARVGGQHDDET